MLAMYSVPVLGGVVMGAAGFASLITRGAGAWFALAAQIRLEHRQLRDQFI